MAIQPIDLQTMYTQLDKVSKSTVAQQQGAQIARELRQDELQKQEFLRSETVKELQSDDGVVQSVDDKDGGNAQGGKKRKQAQKNGASQVEEKKIVYLTESYLGHNIDVSG